MTLFEKLIFQATNMLQMQLCFTAFCIQLKLYFHEMVLSTMIKQ